MCNHIILLAEDDTDDQELIISAFSRIDPSFQLYIVNDGKEAVDYLLHAPSDQLPCVILLDYNMPELNGAQVIQLLSPDKRLERIPKVILSTSGNPRYKEECLKKGAHDYRVKPHDFQGLLGIVKDLVALCHSAN